MGLDAGVLQEFLERARQRFPSFDVEAQSFAQRLAQSADSGTAPADIQVEDLFLAMACEAGDPAALATVEELYESQVELGLSRIGLDQDARQDVRQRLRLKLFVRQGEQPPRIAIYSGKGPLGRWLQVAVMREALNYTRGTRREQTGEISILERAVAPEEDQELRYLKGLYRAEFKSAFSDALGALEPRDRALLRYKLVDGFGIDQIGVVFGVHRATAARWLERVRARLLQETRDRLVDQLRLEGEEFDSIMRLIQSELDVSIHRLLSESEAADTPLS